MRSRSPSCISRSAASSISLIQHAPRRAPRASRMSSSVSSRRLTAKRSSPGTATAAPGQPTLLYFHGNGGALEVRAERIAKYLDRGRGLFMMSYRGYSGSTGSPSEAANVADAKLAYEALIEDGVSPDDIILYGELLGTGVAIEVAAEKKVAGVILDSPFTSIVERAAQLYPWLPVRPLAAGPLRLDPPHPRRSRADIHSPRRSRRHHSCRYGATIVPSCQRAEGDPDAPRRRARGSLQVWVVRNHQSMDRQTPRRATVSAELSIAPKQKTRERFAGLRKSHIRSCGTSGKCLRSRCRRRYGIHRRSRHHRSCRLQHHPRHPGRDHHQDRLCRRGHRVQRPAC